MESVRIFAKIFSFVKRIAKGENPLVVRHTSVQWDIQYSKGKWNRLTDKIPPNTQSIAQMIVEGQSPCRVLDVGCGGGALYSVLKNYSLWVEYVGVDFSRSAILQARKRFPEARFILGDVLHPKRDWGDQFDYIIFNEVLYYVPAVDVIDRYNRMVSMEGKVIVSMYRSWRTAIIALLLWYKKNASFSFVKGGINSPNYFLMKIAHKVKALFGVSVEEFSVLITTL